jgi:sterol desaturase/sphingolipid hydroxylase (fatty acid hydroxylase superfamily)
MELLQNEFSVWLFLQGFLAQAAGYFTVVGVVYLLIWKLGAARLAVLRIPNRGRFNRKQLLHEIRHTLITLFTGMLSTIVIAWLYAGGYTQLTSDAAAIGWPWNILTFIGLIVFNDAWFYGWHRLLHHPKIFKRVHAVHHRSVDVNPFSSYSFHALEGFLLGAWTIPVFLLVPIYLPMLGALQALGLANNVISHLGYELLPRRYARLWPFQWFSSATYHALHHGRFNGNYGLFFRFWDRMLGTEVPDYEEVFLKRSYADEPEVEVLTANQLRESH